jgi:hypothetical protein
LTCPVKTAQQTLRTFGYQQLFGHNFLSRKTVCLSKQQLLKIITLLVVSVLAYAVQFVQAETRLRMVLNNGTVSPNMTCNANDQALIYRAFERPLNRRNLRKVANSGSNERAVTFVDSLEDAHRDLDEIGSASYCRDECKNIGNCYKTGCHWYVGKRQ